MFKSMTKYNRKPKSIFNDNMQSNPNQGVLFKNANEVRHSLYRFANMKFYNLNLNTDIVGIDIEIRKNESISTYYAGVLQTHNSNILTWVNPYLYDIMRRSHVTSVDGTFRITPPNYYQCVTVLSTFSFCVFYFYFMFFILNSTKKPQKKT